MPPAVVPKSANQFIERQLDQQLRAVAGALESDALAFYGPLLGGTDDIIRIAVERLKQERRTRKRLALLVTTAGGFIEVVQRVVETIRHHYDHVDVVVPNYAFSAGTVLALSGDAIHMDYYARLGPIDPQVQTPKGQMVSALGYLAQWERLMTKAKSPDGLTVAELYLMTNGFDQGELYMYEHARELSVTLLKKWLEAYKFKDWKQTEKRGLAVTSSMKLDRAEEIARALNDTERWHVHGYGISKDVLHNELNLRIDDLDKFPSLCSKIRSYHNLLDDYMIKRGDEGAVHSVGQYLPFS
ncbi:MAG TPA: serine dehydrogenasease [Chloroflexota bacterium]|jgi:hypothetical protein